MSISPSSSFSRDKDPGQVLRSSMTVLYGGSSRNEKIVRQDDSFLASINLIGYCCLLEKRTPHCKLPFVKALIERGKVRMTASAVAGAEALGFDRAGVVDVVSALSSADFFKSMTTYADLKIWQDVYRPTTPLGGRLSETNGHRRCTHRLLIRSYEHEVSCLWRSGTAPRHP